MIKIAVSIFSLLLSTAILILGISLQGTLIGIKADIESFSVTITGIIMSAYFAGFAAGTYICPSIITRVGHIRSYAAMATVASVAAILFAMSTNPVFWMILRIITGFCIVGLYMVIESWLNMLAPDNARGKFFSTYIIITLLSMACGQYLLLLYSPETFRLFAIVSILFSLALVPIAMTRIKQPELIETPKLNITFLFRKSPQGMIGAFISGIVVSSFYGMMPTYASRIGLSNEDIAMLIAITIFGGAALQWPIGLISDKYDRRIVLALISLTASIIAFLLYVINQNIMWFFYLLSFAFGGFIFSLYGLSVAHVNDRISKEQTLESIKGLMQIYGIGAVIGPIIASVNMNLLGPSGIQVFFALTLLFLSIFTILRASISDAPLEEEQTDFVVMNRTSPVALEMSPQTNDS